MRIDPNTKRLREVPTREARLAAGEVIIPTYIHFITAKELTAEEQLVRQQQAADQIRVLNRAYSGRSSDKAFNTPFRFSLVLADFTVDSAWATMKFGSAAERQAKAALRVGGSDTLNIYAANIGGRLARLGHLPAEVSSGTQPMTASSS